MSSYSGAPLWALAAPLSEAFGSDVVVSRAGQTVCWEYKGQSAIVELLSNETLRATFIDSTHHDLVAEQAASAAYHSTVTYALSASSARHMIADLVDFFSGEREPRFTFIDAYAR